jgi:hypothetical protein
VYIKDWFKQIFHIFLNLLFRDLRFLISKVEFVTSPPPFLLTKQRLGAGQPCCYFNRNIAFAKILCLQNLLPFLLQAPKVRSAIVISKLTNSCAHHVVIPYLYMPSNNCTKYVGYSVFCLMATKEPLKPNIW